MSADTTPVILITMGENGEREYRFAVAQAWENAWEYDGEGRYLDGRYVIRIFGQSPVFSDLHLAEEALWRFIEDGCWIIEYGLDLLDLGAVVTWKQLVADTARAA